MIQICFVCLGNICRSPTAEGVMRAQVEAAGLAGQISVASAGTAGYHAGELPDPRTREAARRRGILLTSRARQFRAADFDRFDHVLAMDRSNHANLLRMAGGRSRPALQLLREFDPAAGTDLDVPDPYYGGADGFEHVLDICAAACEGLLATLRRDHGL